MRNLLILLVCFLFNQTILGSSFQIEKNWTPIFQGIEYLFFNGPSDHGQLRIHAVRLDLDNKDISLVTGGNSNVKSKASKFLETHDAQVAISGPERSSKGKSFFDPTADLQTLVQVILNHTKDPRLLESDGSEEFKDIKVLVENGVAIHDMDDERLARSAMGLSEDSKSLFFVIVEGGPRHGFFFKDLISIGVLPWELAKIMIDLGAYKAVQINTNRFPSLSVRDQKIYKLSLAIDQRDDGEMEMESHLGFKALPLLPPLDNKIILDAVAKDQAKTKLFRNELRTYGAADTSHFQEKCEDFRVVLPNPKPERVLVFQDLKQIDRKYRGAAPGGIFRDANEVAWVVKSGSPAFQPVHEYIGGRLLNYFYGDQAPVLKIVVNNEAKEQHELMIASKQIIGFESIELRKPHSEKLVEGLADLKVAMDWIGLSDRHDGNQGYIWKDGKYTAARIDFDNSFDDGFFNWQSPFTSMVNLLSNDIENFGFAELELATQRLLSIPDEVVVDVVKSSCQDLYDFGKIDYCAQKPFESAENIAKVLNARKRAVKSFDMGTQYFTRIYGSGAKTKVHVIKVDAKKMAIRTMPTQNFDDPETTFEIANRTRAVAAINGGFWNYGEFGGFTNRWVPHRVKRAFVDYLGLHRAYRSVGPFYSAHPEGSFKSVEPKLDRFDYSATTLGWNSLDEVILLGSSLSIFLNENDTGLSEGASNVSKTVADERAFQRMDSALSVHPILIVDGESQKNLNQNKALRGNQFIPRSGVCIHKSGDWNLVVAEAATLDFFVEIMEKLQCKSAFNLDGSGSSSIVFKGKEMYSGNKVAVVGLPSPRHVSDAIVVFDKLALDTDVLD